MADGSSDSSTGQPNTNPPDLAEVEAAAARVNEAMTVMRSVVVGQLHLVDALMVSLLSGGHCLLEGVPGVAKTLAVRTFAQVAGGTFARLQFTPDLVPSDIVGTRIYRPGTEKFDTELGPVFVNFVLADEVNRAPAKVQAAMLELMAEHQVSLGGTTYPLPKPFMVLATQNPVESEGVYPLPEAQRDRFLMKIVVPLPNASEEAEILQRMSVRPPRASEVLSTDEITKLQDLSSRLYTHPLVADYVVRLVMATRSPREYGAADIEGVLETGASPRATLGLLSAARSLAVLRGRNYVLPEDVQAIAVDVMAHRLILGFDAIADGVSAESIVQRLVAAVPPPVQVPDAAPHLTNSAW